MKLFAQLICVTLIFASLEALGQNLEDVVRFRLTNTQANQSDESVIRFHGNASKSFDGNFDAFKLFSTNPTIHSMFSRSSEGFDLSINAYPVLDQDYQVILYTRSPLGGVFTLSYEILGAFDNNAFISVRDLSTGIDHTLGAGFPLQVTLPASSDTLASFLVTFSLPPQVRVSEPGCKGSKDGAIEIQDAGNPEFSYSLEDGRGVLVASATVTQEAIMIAGLEPGDYVLQVNSGAGEVHDFRVAIEELDAPTLKSTILPTSCSGDDDGSMSLCVDGTGPFLFEWSHATIGGNCAYDLSPGTYTVTVTDGLGCSFAVSDSVGYGTPLLLDPDVFGVNGSLAPNEIISFTNHGTNADSTLWVFHDNQIMIGASADRIYRREGSYSVIVSGFSGNCIDTDTIEFEVREQAVGIGNSALGSSHQNPPIYMNNGFLFFSQAATVMNLIDVAVFDMNGACVARQNIENQHPESALLNVSDLSPATYIVQVQTEETQFAQKVVFSF